MRSCSSIEIRPGWDFVLEIVSTGPWWAYLGQSKVIVSVAGDVSRYPQSESGLLRLAPFLDASFAEREDAESGNFVRVSSTMF